jgi:ubiquinone biosynthesis protein UbiJ
LQKYTGLKLDVNIRVSGDVGSNENTGVSANKINLYWKILQRKMHRFLMQGEDLTELLRQDKIIIHGDVKTAQLLVDLLQQVEFDFEEELKPTIYHTRGEHANHYTTDEHANHYTTDEHDKTNQYTR